MTDTTYTVINRHGTVEERHLTAAEAAHAIITYDGFAYEVRRAEGYDVGDESQWSLWCSDGSAASTRGAAHLRDTLLSIGPVYAPDAGTAWAKLAERVIARADWWSGMACMTDADHAAIVAESTRAPD